MSRQRRRSSGRMADRRQGRVIPPLFVAPRSWLAINAGFRPALDLPSSETLRPTFTRQRVSLPPFASPTDRREIRPAQGLPSSETLRPTFTRQRVSLPPFASPTPQQFCGASAKRRMVRWGHTGGCGREDNAPFTDARHRPVGLTDLLFHLLLRQKVEPKGDHDQSPAARLPHRLYAQARRPPGPR